MLLITGNMPGDFFPWYNGWDRSGEASPSGVCISHPEGDIKMVSTYSEPVVSTYYNNTSPDESGNYWKVNWTETQSGYGVTEAGSSGSPLFDASGNIVGSLTGGQASCSSPGQPDFYGKFSYSWTSNGDDSTRQLKYWLDPANTGVLSLKGTDFDTAGFYADFSADAEWITPGEAVVFNSNSSGNIVRYQWLFPGGDPGTYTGEIPPPVRYGSVGSFDVKLTITNNSEDTDVKLKKAFIKVTPGVFPNPTSGKAIIFFGKEGADLENATIYAYDITGRKINFFAKATDDGAGLVVDLSTLRRGMYLLRIVSNGNTRVVKVIVSK